MALQVWLPLDGDVRNYGLMENFPNPTWSSLLTTTNNISKIGSYSMHPGYLWHFTTDTMPFKNDYTVAFWVYKTALGQYNDILCVTNGKTSDDHLWYISIESGRPRFNELHSSAINTNTWYHIACVKQNNKEYLYINGEL
jgi:hypothetical protein